MWGAPFALSDEAGLTRTCQKVLVWGSIDANLSAISYTWWESEKVAKQLKAFRRVRWPLSKVWLYPTAQITFPQALCLPLLEKLGLEYPKHDSADVTQLRTLAVTGAAVTGDPA